jgi:hypothetical protein
MQILLLLRIISLPNERLIHANADAKSLDHDVIM